MAGIYIHIPFCKQACHYCNFHFSTSLRYKENLLLAIHQELKERRAYLGGKTVKTVYFGGGTPSLLTAAEIQAIYNIIQTEYTLAPNLEVTLEANPDDLTPAYLQSLSATAINRFSIGVQSFFEEDLLFMNRAHNSTEAQACIRAAQDAGFENLTIDLIYGAHTTSHEHWKENLQTAFDLKIPHISCYALTVEPKTALAHMVKTGKAPDTEDDHVAEQFEILLEQMSLKGYEQYEISNFCLPGHYAQHNSNYWKGAHYLGVGPAAHSFNGHSRQWNIAHNPKYIKALAEGKTYWEVEVLTLENQYNEYLMTSLRTKWGVKLETLKKWGDERPKAFEIEAQKLITAGQMEQIEDAYVLTGKGKLIANSILSDLFL